MHGIAFGATVYAANSGGTDGIQYGANTDCGYDAAACRAVAARGARALNTSWGGPSGTSWGGSNGQDDYATLAGATAAYARSCGHPTHHEAVAGTPDAHADAPNAVWGWGPVDLKAAMDGPGQVLGAFTVDRGAGVRDVWLTPIGEGALIQRQGEDAAEQAGWQATLRARGWDTAPPTGQSSVDDHAAYATGTARAVAAAARGYHGSPIKTGEGALTLGGAHGSYSGGTFLNASARRA